VTAVFRSSPAQGRLSKLQYRQTVWVRLSLSAFLSLSLSLSFPTLSRIRGWLNAAKRKRNVGSLIFESTTRNSASAFVGWSIYGMFAALAYFQDSQNL